MTDITQTKKTGTHEWAGTTANCMTGCEHNCRYCYARIDALRFHRIKSRADWATPKICSQEKLQRKRRKVAHTIMFPSTHDITPATLGPCMQMMENILRPGNRLLIVSKPHYDCIREICRRFSGYRDQILFRFTITTLYRMTASYWEPGAPSGLNRIEALMLAHLWRFQTSVSCEPLLESDRAVELVEMVDPWVTDTIWIGKMRQVRARVVAGTSEEAIRRIEAGQTDEAVMKVFKSLEDHPKVKWKDSYREVIERMQNAECRTNRMLVAISNP